MRLPTALPQILTAVIALHVADDSFIQPQPGTSAGDHLAGGLIPIAGLALAAALLPRVRAGLRGALTMLIGFVGVMVGSEAAYFTATGHASGDDWTGLLALVAGIAMLVLGGRDLWRSRRREGTAIRRNGRRLGILAVSAIALYVVAMPFAIGYGATHIASPEVPEVDLGRPFEDFSSPLLGVHNVRNALAAIAIGNRVGIAASDLVAGIRTFKGVKRRLETVGVGQGVTVLDDFAHHPTAVHETLSALRTGYPSRRIWAVFEPRSASSCRRVFQDDFARAFGAADEVVIAAVFRSTLPEAERLSEERLVADLEARGQRARYIREVDEIVQRIVAEHRSGDVVVLMSNGGFGGIHRKLLQALA
jgi:hypothetical protein